MPPTNGWIVGLWKGPRYAAPANRAGPVVGVIAKPVDSRRPRSWST